MERFLEKVDYVRCLQSAGFLELDDQEKGNSENPSLAAATTTNSKDPKEATYNESRVVQSITPNAEAQLNAMFETKEFRFFFPNKAIDDGFQAHFLSNHFLYLAINGIGWWVSIIVLLSGVFSRVMRSPTVLSTAIFTAVSCPIVALLLARGPLQIKSQKTRAILHEVHVTVVFLLKLLYLMGLWLIPNDDLATVTEQKIWLHWIMSATISHFSLLVFMVPRTAFAFPSILLYVVALNITVWTTTANWQLPINYLAAQMLLIHVVIVFQIAALTYMESGERVFFHANLQLALKRAETSVALRRVDGVLGFLLPASVLKDIVQGKSVFHRNWATVIQADICNFTRWCSTRTSSQVVEMLSVVFTGLDQLAIVHDVTRIKVLGDGYIAACGLPEVDPKHAEKGLTFGLAMQVELSRCTSAYRDRWGELQVRVGIHSGDVSAGVLSQQRWAYDIYGDTPAIAGILEPLATNGGVLVSETTILLLPKEMKAGIQQREPGPVISVNGGFLQTRLIDLSIEVDLVVYDVESCSRQSSQQSQTARRLFLQEDQGAPALLHRGRVAPDLGRTHPTLEDPKVKLNKTFTRLLASSLVAVTATLLVRWSIEDDAATMDAPVVALLLLLVLGLVNLLLLAPSPQRYVTIGLWFAASSFISPLIGSSDNTLVRHEAAGTLVGLLTATCQLEFNPTWLYYVALLAAAILNFTVWTLLTGIVLVDLFSSVVLVYFYACLIRYAYAAHLEQGTAANDQRNEAIVKSFEEKEILALVLRLKMPDHVVDRLFSDDQGDVLKSSYVIQSCHVAFCQFEGVTKRDDEKGSTAAPSLENLKLLAALMDRTLPSDGTGKFRFLEKIKTIGDVVMLGGSVVPAVAEQVSDEDVLMELLEFAQDLKLRMRLEEELSGARFLIGVDKGEVTTATVGNFNLEYDVFGTTVNTAARMMATLIAGGAKVEEQPAAGDDAGIETSPGVPALHTSPEPEPSVPVPEYVLIRCTERVIPALNRANYLLQQFGGPRPDAPTYRAVNETFFVAKGLGRLKAYILTCEDNHGKQ